VLNQDVQILHNIVHGSELVDIPTENGDVPTIAKLIKEVEDATGYVVAGTFSSGCTLTSFNHIVSDGTLYWRWSGAFPKIVSAGSTPTPSGGNAWNVVGDFALRDDLSVADSDVLISGTEAALVASAYKKTTAIETGRANNQGVVSFIFDDGYASAISTVAPMFEARNIRCGFAIPYRLLGGVGFLTKADVIDLYARGFEIGNHTLNNTQLTTGSALDPATGEAEIVGGYKELAALGVDPRFFVAVSSSLDSKFKPYVPINHDLSFPRGTASSGASGVQSSTLDRYDLKRDSLFSIGVAGAKATIDYIAANGGYAQFYDHDPLQSGFPSSLNSAQIAEILDYAIAQGVRIETPSKALDLCSADLVNSRDLSIDSINGKNSLISTSNLITDSEFTSFGQSNGTLAPLTAWIIEKTGAGTVTPSRLGGSAGALSLTLSAGFASGNTIVVKNETVAYGSASAYNRNSIICFAIDVAGINNNFETYYTSVVEIQFRKTSDKTVITSKAVNVDLFPFMRTIYASLPTPIGVDFYVTALVRFTVVSPLAVTVILSKPVISLTATPATYEPTKDSLSRIVNEPLSWRQNSTVIPTNTRTTIPITTGAVQNDIGRFDAGSFYAFQRGLYRIDWTNVASGANSLMAGARTIVGINKNGASDHEFEGVGQGTRSVFSMSTFIRLEPLDYISAYIAQYSSVSVTTDGGTTCPFRVTYLG
jgi:peptidoglycan/xylan/chitin deacetylase (PgdA/CDA1 family)